MERAGIEPLSSCSAKDFSKHLTIEASLSIEIQRLMWATMQDISNCSVPCHLNISIDYPILGEQQIVTRLGTKNSVTKQLETSCTENKVL